MVWAAGNFSRGNGVHSGASTWADDAAAGTGITASRHDTHDEDLADGIDACLTKDGANSPSAHLTWIKANYWGGTSAGSANAQTVSLSPALGALAAGVRIVFIAGFSSTAAWTLNPNSIGATAVVDCDAVANKALALIFDGTVFRPENNCGTSIYDRITTATQVVSSTTETAIYSRSIAANTMGTRRALRLMIHGRLTNATGSDQAPIFRVKFGSTTMLTSGAFVVLTSNALNRNFYLSVLLTPVNSAASQKVFADLNVSSPITPGEFNVQTYSGFTAFASGYGTATEDTTSAKTLSVTVEHSANHPSMSCILDGATLELL